MSGPSTKDRILYSVASQTIDYEAYEGRPSADGTVTLYDVRHARSDTVYNPIVTGTATRISASTTISGSTGAAQSNPRLITVTPPAALKIGHFIRLQNTSLQSERAEIVAIATATITVSHDLAFDYASGDTFNSALMTSPAVPTAWASEDDNLGDDYEAVWSYTVNGVSYVKTTRWDLVREVPDTQVFDSDLLERMPALWRHKFSAPPETFGPLIKAAQKDVDAFLVGMNINPTRVRGNELVKHLVVLRTFVLVADNGRKPAGVDSSDSFYQRKKEEWDQMTVLLTNGTLKIPYDGNHDGIITASERAMQPVRLVR